MDLQENLKKLLREIDAAALAFGRERKEITLLPVTKEVGPEEILHLYTLGFREFGESRLQNALKKMESLPKDIQWHFVGRLQKNKVAKVVEHFSLIHSIDTFELAKVVSECSLKASKVTAILLEVNTSKELSKAGLSPEEWMGVFEEVLKLPNLKVQGLMTMAPLTEDPQILHNTFSRLKRLRDEINASQKQVSLHTLSMGMSSDFKIAIEEGATLLRIGSRLFRCRD